MATAVDALSAARVRPAPWWIRAAAAVVARAPAGRYRLAHAMRHLARRPFLMRLPASLGGYAFSCDIRDSVAREVCFTGLYEPPETLVAARLLRPGMTVVDVGANWGYFTLAAAHWVGPSGRVIAFEPERRVFSLLHGNVVRNGLPQVTARRLAVSDRQRSLGLQVFDERSGNWGTSQVVDGAADDACDAIALDDALGREGVARVDLLKIDVEGAELDVLSGMADGLASHRYRSILLECHPAALAARGASMSDCVAPAVARGYRVLSIDQRPDAYRRAALGTISCRELLRPMADAAADAWPHLLLVAPGMADPD